MSEVKTVKVAALMDVLPELVDELRGKLPADRSENLDLAYDWLLQQEQVSYTEQHVVLPSDSVSSVSYLVGKTCPCPDATHRGNARCKHIQRAWLFVTTLRRLDGSAQVSRAA